MRNFTLSRVLSVAVLASAAILSLRAATTINVSDTVATANAKRLGLCLGFHTYYDSRLLMKELCYRNPGFEGLVFQSALPLASGTATGCVDATPFTQWQNGFWNGAHYEFIWGAAKGRSGTIAEYFRPPPQTTPTTGSTYVFADSGGAPAAGDWIVLRKVEDSDPAAGWWVASTNVTITGELADLPPDTLGRQALHAVAPNAPANLQLASNFDTTPGQTFITLAGHYRVTFKAKSRSAAPVQLNVRVVRGNTTYLNSVVMPNPAWTTHSFEFDAAETGIPQGPVSLQFTAFGQFDLLLDDVSFMQTDSDPLHPNPTAFRDSVVDALKLYHPGLLRGLQTGLGETLDNQLAPVLGRRRAEFHTYATTGPQIQYGWHEFLELCEFVDTEPWLVVPVMFSPQDMTNLMEYLGGDAATTVYGALRAARGHPQPWTEVFQNKKIHLEFGNESWNGDVFLGGIIGAPVAYGNRGSEVLGAARTSPYYRSEQFNLILNAHMAETQRLMAIHNASTNHDTMCADAYFYSRVDNYGTIDELFGSMFAQSEWMVQSTFVRSAWNALQASSRPVPLATYEGNINTYNGTIVNSQAALTALTPSLGAGLAVANDMLMKLRDLHMRDQNLFGLGGYMWNITPPGTRSYIHGVTRDMGVTNRKRPQFVAAQLANEAIVGNVLQTAHTGDNPTWLQPAINQMPTTFTAHYLHSYAFAAPAGTQRALIVFNVHRSLPLTVNFSGPNAPAGTITLKRLTSPNISDNNEDANVVAVSTSTLRNFNPAQDFMLPAYSMTVLQWDVDSSPAAPAGAQP